MAEVALYFFRQKIWFFYSGLLALASLYSYLLALYFLDWSDFQVDMFSILLVFSLVWIVLFVVSFKRNRQKYTLEREKEKYNLLRHQVTQEYQLNMHDNIFARVDLIASFMKDNFSAEGLLSIRVQKLSNSSLTLYIENLRLKKQLEYAYSLSSSAEQKEFYQKEMLKNAEQNGAIEENLDTFIKELIGKNNNDGKISGMLSEFEHSLKLLSKIKPR